MNAEPSSAPSFTVLAKYVLVLGLPRCVGMTWTPTKQRDINLGDGFDTISVVRLFSSTKIERRAEWQIERIRMLEIMSIYAILSII